MNQTYTLKQKTKQFLIILLPILVTQLSMYAMTFFDTVMSGHASARDLAGVAIGSSIWMPVMTGLTGIMLSVTPIVAQYIGAGKKDKAPFTIIQGTYLAIALAIIILLAGLLGLKPILNGMQLEADVHDIAFRYLKAIALGIIPLFVYTVFRCFIDALGQTRVTIVISLLSLPVNIILNYLLIYGHLGFPRLGGVGAGYATAITYWFMALLVLHIVHHNQPFSDYRVLYKWYKISIIAWKELLKIGVPIGFAIFFESSIFAAVTLLMSQYDTVTIAAHQVALNFSSFLYMVPLSISMTLTIVVGFEVGAKRYLDARKYSYLGIGIAIGMACMTALLLLIFNKQVASIYSSDLSVIELGQQFLYYAIFFQLFDAVATPTQGALRGYKDVNVSFIVALFSYWIIGLPSDYLLANYTSMEAFGYWLGLITGLGVGSLCLGCRLIRKQYKIKQHSQP